jgi:hypothetical protein
MQEGSAIREQRKLGPGRLELTGLRDIGTEGLGTEKQTGSWQGRPRMRFTREAYATVEGGKVGDRAAF